MDNFVDSDWWFWWVLIELVCNWSDFFLLCQLFWGAYEQKHTRAHTNDATTLNCRADALNSVVLVGELRGFELLIELLYNSIFQLVSASCMLFFCGLKTKAQMTCSRKWFIVFPVVRSKLDIELLGRCLNFEGFWFGFDILRGFEYCALRYTWFIGVHCLLIKTRTFVFVRH